MLFRTLASGVLLVLFSASLTFGSMVPRKAPSGVIRLQKAKIMDPSGFDRPMTAATMLVPHGWQTSGGVVWDQRQTSCGKTPVRYEWRATSPDGISAIEILPEEAWSGNNLEFQLPQQQCPNLTITNVRDYATWAVGRLRPGSRILDYRDRPDTVVEMAALNTHERNQFGELRNWIEGGEVLIGYTTNGQEVRESLTFIVLFMLNRMPGVMPGEIRDFLSIIALPTYCVRAPHGQLDFKHADALRRTFAQDPQWGRLMNEHHQKMARINAKGAADRHAIRMQSAAEVAEIYNKTYQDGQASRDRSNERFVQSIRNVETYVDTSSNERIELPNSHNYAWRLKDDTYILTDDPNFQPNRDLGVEGQQLNPAR